MNKTLLFAILGVSAISAALNAAFIIHELGLWPHGKNREKPREGTDRHQSTYDWDVQQTHDYTISHPVSMQLRKLGHADIYNIKDPHDTLRKVIGRYREKPVKSRLDDCVFVTNEILAKYPNDESIDALVKEIGRLIIEQPVNDSL